MKIAGFTQRTPGPPVKGKEHIESGADSQLGFEGDKGECGDEFVNGVDILGGSVVAAAGHSFWSDLRHSARDV